MTEVAQDVFDGLLDDVADRLVLLDPKQHPPPALNPLEGRDHDLVVDNITSICRNIFQRHWGPRTDDLLRSACLTLLRRPHATLALVPPLLSDRIWRAEVTADIDDPAGLGAFWTWYESLPPGVRAEAVGPVLGKLRAFLLRDFVRKVVAYPRSDIHMNRILDGGILLARLPIGELGHETTRLLGSFVLAHTWQAATARAARGEATRRDATIYLDEAPYFLTLPTSLAEMLAAARGYRLSLVLVHQNLAQFTPELRDAVSANARNKILFSVSPEDAKQLARHTEPHLSEYDLAHQGAYQAACRLVIDGRETPAFTITTKPPPEPIRRAAEIRAACAKKVAQAHAKVRPPHARPARPNPTSTAAAGIGAAATGPAGPAGTGPANSGPDAGRANSAPRTAARRIRITPPPDSDPNPPDAANRPLSMPPASHA